MATKAIKRWTVYADWDALPVMLTMPEICAVLKITEPTALKLLNGGELPGIKVGNTWRVSKDALRAYLGGPAEPAASGQIEVLTKVVQELLVEVRQLRTNKNAAAG